ncbi:helix-hairpin-helix domain-containing protein [Natrinema salifodinae]|uniref:Helix-hairpin-helix domain-containing protein n=1 Tax=Natrinema salifodinae TaxID=1202768 RepID=A0A1I0MB47_9EURY|nr:helix-hairpin-helix domain-containing protein [Natrinema salifodinae]SEV85348.1 Helix-hairpin-helix domain-containing protein [Natrinema salifodinae]
MCARFSEDDVEKRVENANGEVIGAITAVEGDTAHVEPKQGVMDSIRAALGWNRTHEDTVLIHEDAIAGVSADVIRLEETDAQADDDTEAESQAATGPPDRADAETDRSDPDIDEDARTEPAAASEPTREADPEPSDGPEFEPEDAAEEPGNAAEREPDRDRGPEPDPTAPRNAAERPSGDGGRGTTADPDAPEPTPEPDRAESEAEGPGDVEEPTEAGATEPSATDEVEPVGSPDEPSPTEETATEPAESPAMAEDAATDDRPSTAEMDLADELDRGVDIESAAGEHDGLDDEPSPTADDDLTDEVNTGVDIAAAADAVEAEGAADADVAGSSSEERDLADELNRGVDIESAAGEHDGLDDEPSPTADDDLTDEVNTGVDIAATADAVETEEAADADVAGSSSEERDLADELNRGPDIESLAAEAREPDADIDPESIAGQEVPAEGGSEGADRRTIAESESDLHSAIDRRPAETADETERTPLEGFDPGSSAATSDRHQATTPLSAMIAVQQAALESSQRAIQQGLALQETMARRALTGQTTLHRQQLRLARTAATAPLEIAAAMTGTETGDRPPRNDEQGSADTAGKRLELVDGLDAMYRRRLVDAGIASLDDLARADRETVADAAGVTEARAAGWIEQVDV